MPDANVWVDHEHMHGSGSLSIKHKHPHPHTGADSKRDCMTFRHMHHKDLQDTVNMVVSHRVVSPKKGNPGGNADRIIKALQDENAELQSKIAAMHSSLRIAVELLCNVAANIEQLYAHEGETHD